MDGHGVQLFFLVSSLTLALSWAARRDRRPLAAFLTRRLFRVGPMFLVGVAFYLWWYGTAPRFFAPSGVGASDVALTTGFAHRWLSQTFNAVVPGGWSIAVESNFYLLAPLLFAFARTPARSVAAFVACWAAWVATDLARFPDRWFVDADPDLVGFFARHWLPAQLPVFALGVVVFHAVKPGAEPSRSTAPLLLAVVPPLLLTGTLFVPDTLRIAATFALLVWMVRLSPPVLLVNAATRFVGRISYSVYLLHFAGLDVGRHPAQDVPEGRVNAGTQHGRRTPRAMGSVTAPQINKLPSVCHYIEFVISCARRHTSPGVWRRLVVSLVDRPHCTHQVNDGRQEQFERSGDRPHPVLRPRLQTQGLDRGPRHPPRYVGGAHVLHPPPLRLRGPVRAGGRETR